MSKRLALTLSDDTHAQLEACAAEAGTDLHAWIVAAVEREAFRRLCERANDWWAARPEAVAAEKEAHQRRQELRAQVERDRGSSAA
ncbi:hypothetical protein [Amycolatopsis anabasis]|uniref:hypothetical protein n=1 Tax=Amycolatopsis anabasis TaxID=1840409 RepID=UPI00131C74B6|nr:hypothetical protein [Amycolatopsis anabasis]